MINEKYKELGYKPSEIRALYEYGKNLKKRVGEDNVYDFSIGNPSIPSPDIVNDTLISLLKNSDQVSLHGYTSSYGDREVTKRIEEYLNKTYNAKVESRLIYMSCGAAPGLASSFSALSNPGDEGIVIAPYFPEYKIFMDQAGVTLVSSLADKDFMIDFDDLEKKITPKTSFIVIDSPNNPSGALYTEDVIKRLADLLSKKEAEYHKDIYLISDEPYRELVYDDVKYPFVTNYYHNSIVCYSFSKSLSLPGERIGYILVNPKANHAEDVFAAISGAARSLGYICAPALFQHLIPYVLGYTSDLSVYKTNRDLLYRGLKEIGYDVVYPSGAFYIFLKCLEPSAYKFSERAKEYNLILVPSDSFGVEGYVRLAYCVDTDMIKRSLKAFKKLYDSYRG